MYLKACSHQPGSKPGFQHALKLSYNTIEKDRLSFGEGQKSLVYRYHFSDHVPKASVGVFTALMDELSTMACFRSSLPGPPGASVQMQTELLTHDIQQLKDGIDIVNTVTKLGRKISHTRTEFVCPSTQRQIAFSSHVKYMPSGSVLLDWFFSSNVLFRIYNKFYLGRLPNPPHYEETSLIKDVLQSHISFGGIGRATFHVTSEHTNPFGVMHGGMQAMVMEHVGESFARAELKSDDILLEAIHMEFFRAVKVGGSIDVTCENIGLAEHGSQLHIRVILLNRGKVSSEGKLRFAKSKLS